ncbi:HNH endonuclease [Mycobacterium phage Quesadilla]|uniref:Uncharacterized protein n=1 Tax=Mycobacterium phage Quesadilla TaxID=2664226 RepID=A0A5Q2WA08_9CAUD|nr:HNH endonuclease [Mycobacterium phage Quesadilla]QGH75336.1 hypothetical protein SEA_QUESADILLA_88 [Mycobacterium phage Quesadilla]
MDPDANLLELLDIAREHQAEVDDESRSNHADTGRMADLVLALHGWLSDGGTLPAAWHLSTCMSSDCRAAEAEEPPGSDADPMPIRAIRPGDGPY